MKKQRLVVGISGGSGAILGIRLLQALQGSEIETHLVVTPAARLTIEQETQYSPTDVLAMAAHHYNPRDIAAPIASGSFDTMGMIVIPCSIKSLSAIANSYSDDLLVRAADVTLKEGRPLLLVVREAPLHKGHTRLMDLAAQAGAILFPPVPAFYTHPQTVQEIVDNIVGRVLRRMGIENDLYSRWQGITEPQPTGESEPVAAAQEPVIEEPADNEFWELPAMSLATTSPAGQSHAATVYFAADEAHENLYFFSAASSQHSQDVAANPQAAATIYPPTQDWRQIRGLQLRGTVTPLTPGEEWNRAWQVYTGKFPFVKDLKSIVDENILYTFRPTWFRRVDNRRGFGYKEEGTQP